MKFQYILLALFFFLFSCSDRAGNPSTGHGGEALISGTLLDSSGNAAVNYELTLSTSDYSEFSKGTTPIKTCSNNSGAFTISVEEFGYYTLTSRAGNSFLYLNYIQIGKINDSINFNQVQMRNGVEVYIEPWWNNDETENKIAIIGTPWLFSIDDKKTDTLRLPEGELSLIRFSSTKVSPDTLTITIKEGMTIWKK